MRIVFFGAALALVSTVVWAQQPAAQSPAPAAKTFASAADVAALMAKAKSERKPDQANFVQPVIQLPPYTMNLEYRVAVASSNAMVHELTAELFYVVEGSGTLVTGGRLRDEKRANASNLSGSGIESGSSRRVAKGDFVVVPENTPHWFIDIDGVLVLTSLHLPRAGTK